MSVPILKQGDCLIALVQGALTDADLLELRDRLSDRVGEIRARGVVIELSALDVLDSFACLTIQVIAETTRLRGADAVVVGIQPDVAFAMVQLGLRLPGVKTALDLEEGLEQLAQSRTPAERDVR